MTIDTPTTLHRRAIAADAAAYAAFIEALPGAEQDTACAAYLAAHRLVEATREALRRAQ